MLAFPQTVLALEVQQNRPRAPNKRPREFTNGPKATQMCPTLTKGLLFGAHSVALTDEAGRVIDCLIL